MCVVLPANYKSMDCLDTQPKYCVVFSLAFPVTVDLLRFPHPCVPPLPPFPPPAPPPPAFPTPRT